MPENILKSVYTEMQKEMAATLSAGASAFSHPPTKGEVVERDWILWLRNYLPKRYAVDKGFVIDHLGKKSEQIDIIIYDTQYSYFVFHHNDYLLIPAESVYAVFEVKSSLNKETIEYAGKKAKSVRELNRTSAPIRHAGGEYSPKPLHEIIAGILTTSSDWAEPISSHVIRYIQASDRLVRLDIVSSISSSTFSISNNMLVDECGESTAPIIQYCNEDETLVFLLLSLLIKLQAIGTVPAIDFTKYAEALNVKRI